MSDDFFASVHSLLRVEPAASLKGQFGPNGALYDGWESRRHNPAFDWAIIKLGTTGTISGFDVDTSNFNGNEAPQVSIEVLSAEDADDKDPSHDSPQWKEVLPRVDMDPTSRHLFTIPETQSVTYVKLNMYPDGGIARFRVYGHVTPVFPASVEQVFDLAHVFAGGTVIFTSDQHFGVGSNLILPGRGKDMGDGWETKRSRTPGHKDWVIIRLGTPGYLEHAEIDTAHFKGNFPESCELEAFSGDDDAVLKSDAEWTSILPRTKVGPHRQHYFQLQNVSDRQYSHVKMTIHPDGGVKRIRVMGRRTPSQSSSSASQEIPALLPPRADLPLLGQFVKNAVSSAVAGKTAGKVVSALPLTAEAFLPFGQVIQAYEENSAPRSVKITPANAGTADKFHKLALTQSSYPDGSNASTGISVYRCRPASPSDGLVSIRDLERHPHTNQAFVPMGSGSGDVRYLVVVALNKDDGQPDLESLRAFIATGHQGIVYNAAVWHQPMTVLGQTLDLACVETQIGDGNALDCEVLNLKEPVPHAKVA